MLRKQTDEIHRSAQNTNRAIFLATSVLGQVTNADEYSPSEELAAMRKRRGNNFQYPAREATNKPRRTNMCNHESSSGYGKKLHL